MLKTCHTWLAALALAALFFSSSYAQAADFQCGSAVSERFATSVASSAVLSEPRIILAQATMMQQGQGNNVQGTIERRVRLPARVPSGQTYAIQTEGQRSFKKFSSGATLAQTDCAQIPCPKSFEPGTVCWKCVESFTQ